MKGIAMNDGVVFYVDDSDYGMANKYRWTNMNGRPEARINGKPILFYRWLLGVPRGIEVDHIDGNTLNNSRMNLRTCTRKQNSYNREFQKEGKHSQYKGVTWHIRNKVWQASIRADGTLKHIGTYKTEHEAAVAYNKAATKHFGEFAWLNAV